MKTIIEDIDLVYLLGKGSKHDDLELILSLRSVDKFLTNYRNIYIVGLDVSDILKTSFKHAMFNIVVEDTRKQFPQKRKLTKLVNMCELEELSDNFLLMSDDYLFLQKTDARSIPYYWKGPIVRYSKKRVITTGVMKVEVSYDDKMSIANDDTFRVLSSNKMRKLNYETKTPFVINKKRFAKMIDSFYWDVFRFGLLYKTLYANYCDNIIEPIKMDSVEISQETPDKTYDQLAKIKPFISITGAAFTKKTIMYLMKKFKKKSQWER